MVLKSWKYVVMFLAFIVFFNRAPCRAKLQKRLPDKVLTLRASAVDRGEAAAEGILSFCFVPKPLENYAVCNISAY